MRVCQPRRALTITELLTVVSVIAILTSMMSPVLLRAQQESIRGKCTVNIKRIHEALELYRNHNTGKFPNCFDLNPGGGSSQTVQEDSWWYRKVAREMWKPAIVSGKLYDQLNVPRSRSWGSTGRNSGLKKFDPGDMPLRCPASSDNHDESYGDPYKPRCIESTELDKDRVFDDCYGYNNFGDQAAKKYGFVYASGCGDTCVLHYQNGSSGPFFHISKLYHSGYGGTNAKIKGTFKDDPSSSWTHIGALTEFAEPSITIVLSDYYKADASPTIDQKVADFDGDGETELRDGHAFRHGGKGNFLCADGHIEGFRERLFRRANGDGAIRWDVRKDMKKRSND